MFYSITRYSIVEQNETPDSENKDTFLELLELISKLNPVIKTKLEFKIAKYTHHNIKNELLSAMSDKVLEI